MTNYAVVKNHIAELAIQSGRSPEDVQLIVVTKNHSLEEILPIYEQGQRQFAENRQQEASEKMLRAPEDIQWHFIGTLQKNKVRKVVGSFACIHSVDSYDLAEHISICSQEKGVVTKVLLQVNCSGEISKHGLDVASWKKRINALMRLPSLDCQGLMTMAPLTDNLDVVRACFRGLREFRDELIAEGYSSFVHLSMGMSNDYPIAIEEGATLLRIGSAIFTH
jgi:pyridoxal phosphate enzyme (YggS family)